MGRVGGAKGGKTCRNEDLEEETGVEQKGGGDVEGVGGALGAAGAGVDAAVVGGAGGAAGVVRGGVDADGRAEDCKGCWGVFIAGLKGRRGWERLAAEAGFEIRSWRHCCGADGRYAKEDEGLEGKRLRQRRMEILSVKTGFLVGIVGMIERMEREEERSTAVPISSSWKNIF